jgi:hypothetical protein
MTLLTVLWNDAAGISVDTHRHFRAFVVYGDGGCSYFRNKLPGVRCVTAVSVSNDKAISLQALRVPEG